MRSLYKIDEKGSQLLISRTLISQSISNIKYHSMDIQSTLVISKSKGPSETLRDIRTSINQICRIEENTNHTIKFNKWTCNLTLLVRNIC